MNTSEIHIINFEEQTIILSPADGSFERATEKTQYNTFNIPHNLADIKMLDIVLENGTPKAINYSVR